ncbi:hypothetical protein ACQR1W_31505 [Bradyrhizobium sp. HKCCYLS1011]
MSKILCAAFLIGAITLGPLAGVAAAAAGLTKLAAILVVLT